VAIVLTAQAASAFERNVALGDGLWVGLSVQQSPLKRSPYPLGMTGTVRWSGALLGAKAEIGVRYPFAVSTGTLTSTIKPYVQLSRDLRVSKVRGIQPYVRFDSTVPIDVWAETKTSYAVGVSAGISEEIAVSPWLVLRHRLDLSLREYVLERSTYSFELAWTLGTAHLVFPHFTTEYAPQTLDKRPRVVVGGRFQMKF